MSRMQRANLKVGCMAVFVILYGVGAYCATGDGRALIIAAWGGFFLLWAVEAETARRWP